MPAHHARVLTIADSDPSRAHVLPPDAPYVRNLAALWAADPRLARAIEALDAPRQPTPPSLDDPPAAPPVAVISYCTEPTRSGPPTVRADAGVGRSVYLHSRYDPVGEAQRLVDGLDFDQHTGFIVHGFGLGYHVEALFDRASDEAIVCVIEPDLRLIQAALMSRDIARLIESRRVLLLTRPDKSELFVRFTPHTALFALGFESLTHGPSERLHADVHAQFRLWVEEFAAYAKTSITTLVLNGRRTAENLARNIGWYVATPGTQRLKNRHKGTPAVIVSAGPSLRKNKHLLKGLEDKAVIVAVQTTLQPLLELGVEPHYVTSLDYHDICTRFFEKLPKTLQTELVAEPKATPAIFSMHPGPLTLLGNDFAEGLLREMRPSKGRLPSGATVAHLAYYLAEHLGCDPIIFVGQDLGFSDGLCYSPGTSYEDVWRPELSRFCTVEMKQWEQIARDKRILRRIPDHAGKPMYTEERLFTYLQQFERDFLRSDRRIIDATEGGARKRGATPMRLTDAIATYCAVTRPIRAEERAELAWHRVHEAIRCIELRRDEARDIERIGRDTLPLLEEVRDHLDDQPRVNTAISRIDALRTRMNGLGPTYDLITQLTQQTELKRFEADRRITAAKVDALERQRRQVGRDIENVRGVIDAAEQFQRLMDEVVATLAAQATKAGPQARAVAA